MRAAALLLGLGLASAAAAAPVAERTLDLPRFGTVTLYGVDEPAAPVALFVSGDGGWNPGVIDMARALAAEHTLVVGVDIVRYLHALERSGDTCSDFAVDFEALSQAVQKRLGRPRYDAPVLVGYSSGATLVYATLAQAPPNTFRGAISLGFCPDLRLPRPPCRRGALAFGPGGDGVVFAPAEAMSAPWVALQGQVDEVCDARRTAAFTTHVGRGEYVALPKVGHGFSVPKRWLPQLRTSFDRLAGDASLVGGQRPAPEAAADVGDLPLVEVPTQAGAGASDLLAILVSGDGGWASLDREVAGVLAERGIPVVGVDSLRYFWTRRTPDEAGRALERIAGHYLAAWQRQRLLLVGYSRGADVLPFMASRLPPALRSRVALVALLGPGRETAFEFHLTDWLGSATRPESQPVLPEVEKLRGQRLLCVYGSREKDSLCPALPAGLATLDERSGAHHFGGDYEAIAERILRAATP